MTMATQQSNPNNRLSRARTATPNAPLREVSEENCYGVFSPPAVNAPIVSAALRTALKARRESLDLTQEAVASRADMPTRAVSAFERGSRLPNFFDFLRLCEATGVDPRVFFNQILEDMNYPVGYIPVRNSQPE
jgi:DNA-binding XRE family transcriptional regulator